jgi:hypothetical protein
VVRLLKTKQLTLCQTLQFRGRSSDALSNIPGRPRKLRSASPAILRTRGGPISLSPLGVREERLSLGPNFRSAESFLGMADDGAELARAILNGRSGHSERAM